MSVRSAERGLHPCRNRDWVSPCLRGDKRAECSLLRRAGFPNPAGIGIGSPPVPWGEQKGGSFSPSRVKACPDVFGRIA